MNTTLFVRTRAIRIQLRGSFNPGANPGFQVRWGALKKMTPSGGRREDFWGISCEKITVLRQKNHILGGGAWIRPSNLCQHFEK
jgi:hypothetical protein